MQKSQVGRFLITALIVFVVLILLALFLAVSLQIGAPAFLEMAWSWLLRLVGLTTVVFSPGTFFKVDCPCLAWPVNDSAELVSGYRSGRPSDRHDGYGVPEEFR